MLLFKTEYPAFVALTSKTSALRTLLSWIRIQLTQKQYRQPTIWEWNGCKYGRPLTITRRDIIREVVRKFFNISGGATVERKHCLHHVKGTANMCKPFSQLAKHNMWRKANTAHPLDDTFSKAKHASASLKHPVLVLKKTLETNALHPIWLSLNYFTTNDESKDAIQNPVVKVLKIVIAKKCHFVLIH